MAGGLGVLLLVALAQAENPAPQLFLNVPWGTGEGKAGRWQPEEAAPEGPMSLVIDDRERVHLLDQVNRRVQVYQDGAWQDSIGLPADTYQDLQLDRHGRLVLLDRLVRRSVDIVDRKGNLLSSIGLEGPGIPEGGGTTGLFVRGDGIWVEVEHWLLVRIADQNYQPVTPRRQVPGRFSADGKRLYLAGLQGRRVVEIAFRPAGHPEAKPRLLARLEFDSRVMRIVELQSERSGRLVLAVQLARFRQTPPFDVIESWLEIVRLEADGQIAEQTTLPVPKNAPEQFRQLHLAGSGQLYRLELDEFGAKVWKMQP